MSELKFIFTGPPGAGKTTAISSISEIPPVVSDVSTTDELSAVKNATTTGLDFGEVVLGDGQKLRLYGTPGQERFRHMWEILARGALGLIILCDNSRPDPLADLEIYTTNFSDLISKTGAVIGVNRLNSSRGPSLDDYYEWMGKKELMFPVMEIDPRQRADVLLLIDTLMTTLEYA